MKYDRYLLVIILTTFVMPILFYSCNSQKGLDYRTNNVIKKGYTQVDTVFQFSNYSNQTDVIWYHDDSLMYVYIIRPYNVKKLEPIIAINSYPNSESIELKNVSLILLTKKILVSKIC